VGAKNGKVLENIPARGIGCIQGKNLGRSVLFNRLTIRRREIISKKKRHQIEGKVGTVETGKGSPGKIWGEEMDYGPVDKIFGKGNHISEASMRNRVGEYQDTNLFSKSKKENSDGGEWVLFLKGILIKTESSTSTKALGGGVNGEKKILKTKPLL